MQNTRIRREDVWALAGLLFVLVVTAAWWALALWPSGNDAPRWIARAQAVCFGVGPGGLPDTAGWVGLIGSPLGMVTMLLVVARSAFRNLLRLLWQIRWLQLVSGTVVVFVIAFGFVATTRIRTLSSETDELIRNDYGSAVKSSRTAPGLRLTDQFGAVRDLREFRGRTVFVTFAYAHCATVCPVLVRQTLEAQRALRAAQHPAPAVLIVTLDPARDTPGRLATIAREWQLGGDAYVLSGTGADVARVLDEWGVARTYDPTNGNVTHAAVAYLVNAKSEITYETIAPSQELLTRLAAEL